MVNRWRILVGSVALGAAAARLSSGGIAAATASTDDPSGTAVVECTSGIVTQGDVQTSSLFVAKVPAGEQPDIPGGCTVTTGRSSGPASRAHVVGAARPVRSGLATHERPGATFPGRWLVSAGSCVREPLSGPAASVEEHDA